jgi:prevent-host-death family protein
MKTASITQAKNRLSALLDEVRHGETILIMDRNRPVARLEPVSGDLADSGGILARLERAGIVRRSKAGKPNRLILDHPPRPTQDVDIVKVLLEEREHGR